MIKNLFEQFLWRQFRRVVNGGPREVVEPAGEWKGLKRGREEGVIALAGFARRLHEERRQSNQAPLLQLPQQIAAGDFTISAIGLPKIPEATAPLGKMGST